VRRTLVFLLLFGAGLALLWWLERRGRPAPAIVEPPPGDLPAEPGQESLSIGGRFTAIQYDPITGRALFRIRSDESQTVEGADLFGQARIDVLEPATGEPRATMTAGKARLVRRGDSPALPPEHEDRAELEDVVAEFRSGMPLVPLVVRAPRATIDATDASRRTLVGREGVDFDAASGALRGAGPGLTVRVDERSFDLAQDAWVELDEGGGRTARLTSLGTGPIQVRREQDGGHEQLVIEVWNGARLVLGGPTASDLRAQHLLLRAAPPTERAALALESLEADGDVDWKLADDEFFGGRVSMTFDARGELEQARLQDLPSLHFSLAPEQTLPAGLHPPKAERVRLRSTGAISVVRAGAGTSLDAVGPVTIETEQVTLRSNGDLHGELNDAGAKASFRTAAGVVLDGLGAHLETAVFTLELESGPDREPLVSGVADQGSRLTGQLDDGRPFTLTSPGRMQVERRGSAWRVVDATGVELVVEAVEGVAGPMQARADEVTDFDPGVPRFRARGNVRLASEQGTGSGEELVVEGPRRYTLSSRAPARASLTSPHGDATATAIEVDGDRVRAAGAVEAHLSGLALAPPPGFEELRFDRYDLACDDLTLERRPRAAAAGLEQSFRLEALGSVSSQLRLEGEPSELHGERLVVLRVERFADAAAPVAASSSTTLEASDVTQANLRGPRGDVQLACAALVMRREERPGVEPEQQMQARGRVRFQIESRFDLGGLGESLTIDPDRTAHLEDPSGGRVVLFGRAPNQGGPFRLDADRADVSPTHFSAEAPLISAQGWSASARHLEATETSLDMQGEVHVTGGTALAQAWQLDAGAVRIEATGDAEHVNWSDLRYLRARDDVRFKLGQGLIGLGDEVTSPEAGILRFTGSPARIGTPRFDYEAEWMEFDPSLGIVTATGRGAIHRPEGAEPAAGTAWRLDFLSSTTLVEPDSFVFAMQEPLLRYTSDEVTVDATLHASWSLLWLDRRRWQDLLAGDATALAPPPSSAELPRLFGFLDRSLIPAVIREFYLEGPVEALSGAERVASADAVYLDLDSNLGWLANTTVSVPGKRLGQELDELLIKTDWLRHSPDGSLRADSATVTTCSFDEPHLKLVTGDLSIKPDERDGKAVWDFSLRDNRVELYNRLRVPLARIEFSTDREFNPLWQSFQIANSARFGQLFSLRFSRPARGLGRAFDGLVGLFLSEAERSGNGAQPEKAAQAGAVPGQARPKRRISPDSRYHVDASYLGSRGGLLDLGFSTSVKGRYWYDFFIGTAYDDGEDKGFLRIPLDQRDRLRLWLRSHGTFDRGKNRLSVVYSDQSDFGVQSEFFESRFLSYEQSESYVQWKRRQGEYYGQVSLKARVESFRTDVEELPSADVYRGRAPLFRLGPLSVLHTGTVHADFVRRREGGATGEDLDGDGFPDPLQSPFGYPARFSDGLGDRELARVDTRQSLEAPWRLPFLGLTLVPFVGLHATQWSEGADPDTAPTRLSSEGGVRLGTTLWKEAAKGRMHEIAPYLQVSADITHRVPSETVPIDGIERAWSADLFEVGARSRFFERDGESILDLDLRGTYAHGRTDGIDVGWLPLAVFARLRLEDFGLPLEAWEDLRYDLDARQAVYALTSVGARFGDRFGVQVGHQLGRDPAQTELFDAITLAGFYRWTEKWEFEARQAISLLDDSRLDLDVILRRFGHDAVFEIESSFRDGEGTSLGINLSPLIGFKRNRIGYLKW
jgi:hypothetical protein